ncbi:MAG: metalloregulator ArsR/SmtB family transcription factor [Chloroflexi bacterium]|nr:metalloregulator ArsR/SmtB family transcription factor [Chloroflexota bacterium]
MDELSSTLIDRLLEKTLENMSQEERLAFVEKLFADLPPVAQQTFLLKLTRLLSDDGGELGTLGAAFAAEADAPMMIQVIKMGPEDFGPWQMCCRAMNDFVESPDVDRMETTVMARMFSGLADATRLKIIKLLSEQERTVEELVGLLGIAQSSTSHHLRVLKDAGLIQGDKRGRKIFYSLTHPLVERE